MSGLAWYRRYPSNFLQSTTMLTVEEKGAYSVLLDMMYQNGGPIPDDPAWIARVCGCSKRKWTQVLRPRLIALGKINIREGGLLSNGRMVYETHLSHERIKSAKENGLKPKSRDKSEINDGELLEINHIEHYSASKTPDTRVVEQEVENILPIIEPEINEINTGATYAPSKPEVPTVAPTEQPPENHRPFIGHLSTSKTESLFSETKQLAEADSGLRKVSKKVSKDDATLRVASRARGSRIPENWRPTDEDRKYAIEKGINADLLAEEFVLHWLGAAGASASKVDWSAAFKGRVLVMREQGRFLLNGSTVNGHATIRRMSNAEIREAGVNQLCREWMSGTKSSKQYDFSLDEKSPCIEGELQ